MSKIIYNLGQMSELEMDRELNGIRIAISIEGGCLQAVYSNTPIKYLLIDEDNIKGGDREFDWYEQYSLHTTREMNKMIEESINGEESEI